MIVLLVLVATLAIGFFIHKRSKDEFEFPGVLLMAIGGLLLVIYLIILPLNRQDCFAKIVKIEAFQETVSTSRMGNLSEIERAAILSKIAEWNEWIAETKYYNNTIWDIFIPDEAANLQPIK